MAEEKPTPQNEPVNDTLTADDMDMLREVLQDAHSRGIAPVSVYKQDDLAIDEF
ncbi:MAG TPA: hypothetical protein VLF64_03190 [Candidatus Saccharimonadales bacterium]|nr:hypothetical protein [Candidatus Saccharimonadales bacterium]